MQGKDEETFRIGEMLVQDFLKKVEETMITITIKSQALENFLNDRQENKTRLEDKYKVFIKAEK